MITAIEIENFRAIGEPIRIELAPVTLLFGANSVGKSAVLSAAHFLHSYLGGDFSDDFLEASGGILTPHHRGDKERRLRIRVEALRTDIALFFEGGDEQPLLQRIGVDDDLQRPYYMASAVEMRLFPDDTGWPLVKRALRAEFVGAIGTYEIVRLRRRLVPGFIPERMGVEVNRHTFRELAVETDALTGDIRQQVLEWIASLPDEEWVSLGELAHSRSPGNFKNIVELPESVPSLVGALLFAPFVFVRRHLQDIRHVGPLRRRLAPDERFEGEYTVRLRDWYNGWAAWQVLHHWARREEREALVPRVNTWLRRLNLPHEIVCNTATLVPTGAADTAWGTPVTTFSVRDVDRDVTLAPGELGTGLVQLVPVVVAGCSHWGQTTIVEQPELHVHPAVQADVADLMIESTRQTDPEVASNWLVETHSEHLMLRLMRRIRETSRGTLPRDELYATPESVAIYYLERRDGGVQCTRLRVDEDGDFAAGWPAGFFAERATELGLI